MKNDLIRREDAIRAGREIPDLIFDHYFGNGDVEALMNAIPSVDAVEVVRCRECIHYDPRKFLPCTRLGLFITDEFFCGVGKKAEEAINDGDLQKA